MMRIQIFTRIFEFLPKKNAVFGFFFPSFDAIRLQILKLTFSLFFKKSQPSRKSSRKSPCIYILRKQNQKFKEFHFAEYPERRIYCNIHVLRGKYERGTYSISTIVRSLFLTIFFSNFLLFVSITFSPHHAMDICITNPSLDRKFGTALDPKKIHIHQSGGNTKNLWTRLRNIDARFEETPFPQEKKF